MAKKENGCFVGLRVGEKLVYGEAPAWYYLGKKYKVDRLNKKSQNMFTVWLVQNFHSIQVIPSKRAKEALATGFLKWPEEIKRAAAKEDKERADRKKKRGVHRVRG